jgi:hypothetical protein
VLVPAIGNDPLGGRGQAPNGVVAADVGSESGDSLLPKGVFVFVGGTVRNTGTAATVIAVGGGTVTFASTTNSDDDMFLLKLTASGGGVEYLRGWSTSSSEAISSVAADGQTGAVFVTGFVTPASSDACTGASVSGFALFGLSSVRPRSLGCPVDCRTVDTNARTGEPLCGVFPLASSSPVGFVARVEDGYRDANGRIISQGGASADGALGAVWLKQLGRPYAAGLGGSSQTTRVSIFD